MKATPHLSLPKRLKPYRKSARLSSCHNLQPIEFDFVSLHSKDKRNFNYIQKLKSIYSAPHREPYKVFLKRQLQSLSKEDAEILVKLVIKSICCPIIYDADIYHTVLTDNGQFLKQIFGTYVSEEYIDEVLKTYRNNLQDVTHEFLHEIELLKSNNHPMYKQSDFSSDEEYKVWKEKRIAWIERKIRAIDKIPPFFGKLKITILSAKGLGGSNYTPGSSNSNIYCEIKVGEEVQKTQVKKGTWDPIFGETFYFNIDSPNTRIKIEVWDKKMLLSSFLGCIVSTPEEIMWDSSFKEKREYLLHSRKRSNDTDVSGSIQVQMNMSFRIGPRNEKTENTCDDLTSFFSKTFLNKNETPKQSNENIKVETDNIDYEKYYKYLMYIILLESYEQIQLYEAKNKVKGHQRYASDTTIIDSSNRPKRNFNNNNNHLSLPKFRNMGSLRNSREVGDPAKPKPELQWILDCFLQRYHISRAFSSLIVLEALITSFSLTCEHLTMIHFSLMELEESKITDGLLLSREIELYEKYIQNELKSLLEDALSNYFLRFPDNKPEGALSIIIVLYSLVTTTDSSKLSSFLADKTEAAMMKMYNTVIGDTISDESLLDACKFISEVIEKDYELFSDVFPSESQHSHHLCKFYYTEMLSKNIMSLLRTSPPLTENILAIYSQLKALNQKIVQYNPDIELLPLSQIFEPFVSKWIDKVGSQLNKWCTKIIKQEKWTPISHDEDNPILHSSSAQILFDIINEIFNSYKEFDMRSSKDLKNLLKVIEKAIKTYIQGIFCCVRKELGILRNYTMFSKMLDGLFDFSVDEFKNDSQECNNQEKSTVFQTIQAHNCVWIMNLEYITYRLYEFCNLVINNDEKGSENTKQLFGDLFSLLKQSEFHLIYYVACKFNYQPKLSDDIDTFLSQLHGDNKGKLSNNYVIEKMTPIFDNINLFIKTLSENLDSKVLIMVIEQVWKVLMEHFENKLFPPVLHKKQSSKYSYTSFVRALNALTNFFHADGEGLPMPYLKKESSDIELALKMSSLTTSQLINIYSDLEKGLKPQEPDYINITPIKLECITFSILSQKKNDKDAKKFIKSKYRDDIIWKYFSDKLEISSQETLIDWFTCRNGKENGIDGYLLITTNLLCFISIVPSPYNFKIRLKKIKKIIKKKSSNVTFELKNKIEFSLYSISNTKVYDLIESQSSKIGNTIEIVSSEKKSKSVDSVESKISNVSSSSSLSQVDIKVTKTKKKKKKEV